MLPSLIFWAWINGISNEASGKVTVLYSGGIADENGGSWAVQPALILEQCRLFMNDKMPFAYVSWAFVSDEVHARLQQGQAQLAPHDWKDGQHLWLIDIVIPFGQGDSVIAELKQSVLTGKIVHSSTDQKTNQY